MTDTMNRFIGVKTSMPCETVLDAETFVEKEGIRLLSYEEEKRCFKDISDAREKGDDVLANFLRSHVWTEMSIEGEDEDGNYRRGWHITNGIFRVNRIATWVSKEPWSILVRVGNTTLSVAEGDIYAESWYENDELEFIASSFENETNDH